MKLLNPTEINASHFSYITRMTNKDNSKAILIHKTAAHLSTYVTSRVNSMKIGRNVPAISEESSFTDKLI